MIKAWQTFIKESNTNENSTNDPVNSIVNLDTYGTITVSGEDAKTLLQGQLTCDISLLNNEIFSYGAYCNLKGRIEAFFKVFFWQNKYYLTMPEEIITPTITELQKYILTAKVKVEDTTENIINIGVIGEAPITSLANNFNINFTKDGHNLITRKEYVVIFPQSKIPTAQIICNYIDSAKSLWNNLTKNIDIISTNEWHLVNIRNKLPEVYLNTAGEFLPHNINLPSINAVSFNKGCYRGQEIISRMEYKAKPKKALFRLVSESNIDANNLHIDNIYDIVGEKITQNINDGSKNNIGTVIEIAINSDNKLELLAEMNVDLDISNQYWLHGMNFKITTLEQNYS